MDLCAPQRPELPYKIELTYVQKQDQEKILLFLWRGKNDIRALSASIFNEKFENDTGFSNKCVVLLIFIQMDIRPKTRTYIHN